jgi:acyl-CoA reductase-like NAD-dependent aldehyde dehydrogenase
MPEKKRSELINGTVGALPREARADVRQSIADLIERKKRHFAKIRRIVVDYESKETAGEFHLAVASVPYEA